MSNLSLNDKKKSNQTADTDLTEKGLLEKSKNFSQNSASKIFNSEQKKNNFLSETKSKFQLQMYDDRKNDLNEKLSEKRGFKEEPQNNKPGPMKKVTKESIEIKIDSMQKKIDELELN